MSVFNPPFGEQFAVKDLWDTPSGTYHGGGPYHGSLMSTPAPVKTPNMRQNSGAKEFQANASIAAPGLFSSTNGSLSGMPLAYSVDLDHDRFGFPPSSTNSSFASSSNSFERDEDKLKTPQGDSKHIWTPPNGTYGSSSNGNVGSFSNDFIFAHSPILSSNSIFNRPAQLPSLVQGKNDFLANSGFATPTEPRACNNNNVETLIKSLDQVVLALKSEMRKLETENERINEENRFLRNENEKLRNDRPAEDSSQKNSLSSEEDQQAKDPGTIADGLLPGDKFILPTPPSEAAYSLDDSDGKQGADKAPSQPAQFSSSSSASVASSENGTSSYHEAVVYGLEKTLSMTRIKQDIEQYGLSLACLPRPLIRTPSATPVTVPTTSANSGSVHSVVISFTDQESMNRAITNSVVVDFVLRRVKALRKTKRRSQPAAPPPQTPTAPATLNGDWRKLERSNSSTLGGGPAGLSDQQAGESAVLDD